MEFLSDPAIWVGLLTLVVLEIILGIDNLVFIAILADKLPPHQRDRARQIGLGLAMFMRLGLLTVISWMVTLTTPLFTVAGWGFSGRDLILIGGGLFLVFKATMELHERLEGTIAHAGPNRAYAGFWLVVAQIIAIDAVFSLDAVITAVGMVEDLWVMMTAVVISMAVMLLASKPLTRFVSAHPTVVVLCLSFLLMIGFSLIAEGFGVKVPKGYLYAAIGFSVTIEFFNQLMMRNRVRQEARQPLRERTADAILRLMGGRDAPGAPEAAAVPSDGEDVQQPAFRAEERQMISGVLTLADRSIRRIMTPRGDISWVDCDASPDEVRRLMLQTPHSLFPVCRGSLDQVLGVMRAKDLFTALDEERDLAQAAAAHPPIQVPEQMDVIRLMSVLRQARGSLVLVTDEFGLVQGLVTPHDVLEAIAGEFPDADETPEIVADADGWLVKGSTDLLEVERAIGDLALDGTEEQYHTVAGLLLAQHEQFPVVGERFRFGEFELTVVEVAQRRIERVRMARAQPVADDAE